MAEVVLVHGIGQERHDPADLGASMTADLAVGLRAAGFTPEADALPSRTTLAYFADLFGRPDQQGVAMPAQEDLVAGLLADILRNAAARGPQAADRDEATRALAVATGEHPDAQGPRAALRPLLRAATRMSTFGRLGFALAEQYFWQALGQVAQYFTEPDTRNQIVERLTAQLGPETKIVVAHSLGTVVAYEALHRLAHPLPLLVTLGSPLGLRTVIYERLEPQPPHVPPLLRRWVNILDRDDLIAAEAELGGLFPGAAGVVEPHRLVDNGREPHAARAYLGQAETGRLVGEVLRGA
ncbi:hypothetical protein [Crossiella sp. NPDC003009]